jgi:hypothetical protein
MDKITEAIAHFIGLFHVTIDQARMRESYDRFVAHRDDDAMVQASVHYGPHFAVPYQIQDFDPGLKYSGGAPELVYLEPWSFVRFVPPDVVVEPEDVFYPGFLARKIAMSAGLILPDIPVIGSTANFITQAISLSDDDYFGVGGHGLYFSPEAANNDMLFALARMAADVSPFGDVEIAGSPDAMRELVVTLREQIDALEEKPDPAGDHFVIKGNVIDGHYVNGAKVESEDVPKLEDYHPKEEEEEEAQPQKQVTIEITSETIAQSASVELDAGSNTLINNAIVENFWTAAPVTAVVGNHFEINAIIQINVWCDDDAVTEAVGGWSNGNLATQAFNIASFARFDDFSEDAPESASGFPSYWVVKEIETDLLIVNWLEQITFMTDNDVGVISSSGVTTYVGAGGNFAYNGAILDLMGFGYDLIIIGGSVYDANIIHQVNVLYDSDIVGAVAGFESTGEGSIVTSDNLLWNKGYIYNVGAGDRFEPMPQAYAETADSLAAGNHELSSGVLNDGAFAGKGLLSVLYIKGDLISLNYIKQTNMLGDSDQIALAMHRYDEYPDAQWTVVTGANALLNNAAILDLDSVGKTYVGGEHYSAELLVQANFISSDPELGGQNPDVLVNEAVLFLDDDMLGSSEDDLAYSGQAYHELEGGQGDGLGSLIT